MDSTSTSPAAWSLAQKLSFRFFFIYFLLYIFLTTNGILPYIDKAYEWYIVPFHNLANWIGQHILHLKDPVTIFTNGSGDTTYDNIIILFTAFMSLVGMIIWSVADRQRHDYKRLLYWLSTVLRYFVGITMLSYGFYKVIKLQFPFPSPAVLMEPYGASSPMRLAWNFFGYSTGYNLFTGIAELSCGMLLFFRRTSTLGAVITLIVAGNIMAINYSFDVPVKLFSTTLVMMSLFLIMKDIARFTNFFFFNKTAAPADTTPYRFRKKWKNITLIVLKWALIAYTIILDVTQSVSLAATYGDTGKKPPLYGLYDVKTFVMNKDTLQPLNTATKRWSKLASTYRDGIVVVKFMNDSTKNFNINVDTVKKQITMSMVTDTVNKYHFAYTVPKKDSLVIKGTYQKDSLKMTFHKLDVKKFLLVHRGFHWINEFPFNR